jgi:hypothetical protein
VENCKITGSETSLMRGALYVILFWRKWIVILKTDNPELVLSTFEIRFAKAFSQYANNKNIWKSFKR